MADIINVTPDAALPSTEEAIVQDLQLAKALGYKRPSNIRNLIKRNLAVLETLGIIASRKAMIETGKGAHREVEEFHLNRKQAAFIAARSNTKRGAVATAYMVEVEALFHGGHLAVVDTPEAQAALKAAEERDRERRRALMREEKDDYSRIMKGFKQSSSGPAVTPWEKRREEELKARRRQSRWAAQARKYANPGDPT